MSAPRLPSLLETFNLEAELDQAKSRIPVLSEGNWTDTSNTDPGVVAVRIMLERIERNLYLLSARFANQQFVTHLGNLLGVAPLPPARAGGLASLVVDAGTALPAGAQVSSRITGQVYLTLAPVNQPSAGIVEVGLEALNPGVAANLFEAGQLLELRTPPTSGRVWSVTTLTPLTGGTAGETLAEYQARLPGAVANTTLNTAKDFADAAVNVPGVVRAEVYRGTRRVADDFYPEPGHTTVILVGGGGAAPSPAIVAQARAAMLARSWFNQSDVHPDYPYLHVAGVRNRVVGVSGRLTALPGTDAAALKVQAESRVTAFLQPLSGGQEGTGYRIGQPLHKSELYWALQSLRPLGLAYVDDSSLLVSNGQNLAKDELVTPGTVNFEVLL